METVVRAKPVRGWRVFRVIWSPEEGAMLAPWVASGAYPGRWLQSRTLPSPDNQAGIHAFTRCAPGMLAPLTDLWGYGPWLTVAGAVRAYGAIVEHTDGVIRASRAEVLRLYVPTFHVPDLLRWHLDHPRRRPTEEELSHVWAVASEDGLPPGCRLLRRLGPAERDPIPKDVRRLSIQQVQADLQSRYRVPVRPIRPPQDPLRLLHFLGRLARRYLELVGRG